jgi:hypothetical protein
MKRTGFFEEVSQLPPGPPDMEKIMALARNYALQLLVDGTRE